MGNRQREAGLGRSRTGGRLLRACPEDPAARSAGRHTATPWEVMQVDGGRGEGAAGPEPSVAGGGVGKGESSPVAGAQGSGERAWVEMLLKSSASVCSSCGDQLAPTGVLNQHTFISHNSEAGVKSKVWEGLVSPEASLLDLHPCHLSACPNFLFIKRGCQSDGTGAHPYVLILM